MEYIDANDAKPVQGEECLLLMKNGEIHAGHWLKHANKYQRNTRRWKIYKWNKYVDEGEVTGWRYMADEAFMVEVDDGR